jgi:hypothetical protein
VADAGAPTTLRPVAFALALPGLLDADGDGDPFDGRQHSASAAAPVFDAANRPQSATNDDRVLAWALGTAGRAGLWRRPVADQPWPCEHRHGGAIHGPVHVDYLQQLVILDLQAAAGIAQATGAVASAAAGLVLAGATLSNSIGATLLT